MTEMTLFTDGQSKRECEWCGTRYRPRVPEQRWCRLSCRRQWKAKEGRVSRRLWIRAGRPMQLAEDEQQQERGL